MPRPLKTDRPVRFEVYLPESLYAKVKLELFSEVEGRVPHGRTSELYTELTTRWLKERGVL
jgi:hypothetical protein